MDDGLVIALFRHGLTEANERKAYLGWSDSPLTPNARKQLAPAAIKPERLYSSDLKRCTETAALLFPDRPAVENTEFRELHFGNWEGKTYEDLKDDSHYKSWLNAPFIETPPGGESFKEFAGRIESAWEHMKGDMFSNGIRHSAIVTHGGVIRYLLMKYAPVEKVFWEWNTPHGGGWKLTFKAEDLRRGRRCTLLQEALITANPGG
ncbi:histidine phosphatase family protein [Peribacillus glennii]|uniref:Histidine phosphatase family protein n=1 Tax=Peribacillus glennii TaxID=2303991 RepID=A0A372LA03_9BACI|nr:histidine phosphatase family protein [Peribacillus glennii]RFU62397.1 histidine phosphatase family protein [Peribacillus glennii]